MPYETVGRLTSEGTIEPRQHLLSAVVFAGAALSVKAAPRPKGCQGGLPLHQMMCSCCSLSKASRRAAGSASQL